MEAVAFVNSSQRSSRVAEYLPDATEPVARVKDTSGSTSDWFEILNQGIMGADELHLLKCPPREFLVEPFFKVGDFGIIYAQRGIGKTWLAYLIARGVSQGTSIGLWTCPQPRRVLVVDGEMPLDLSQQRDRQFATSNENLFFLHHQVLFDRTSRDLDLTSPYVQDALERQCTTRQIDLLILDNQSTLLRGVSESDSDSWNLILPFLLKMQRRGIAVLLIVHAGRNNQARGHSRREDRTAWMISLSDRKEDDEQGAKFVSEFTKPSRVCPLSDTPSLLWEFTRKDDGRTHCDCKILTMLDQFRQCLEQGMGSDPGEIAEFLAVSAGYISKLSSKGIKAGWCRKEGRGFAFVS
jgi:putative DNA primase/helicase